MRKMILIGLSVLILTSCQDDNKITEIADNYTKENVLPLFSNSRIVDSTYDISTNSTNPLTPEERVIRLTSSDTIALIEFLNQRYKELVKTDSINTDKFFLFIVNEAFDDTSTINQLDRDSFIHIILHNGLKDTLTIKRMIDDINISRLLVYSDFMTVNSILDATLDGTIYVVRTTVEYGDNSYITVNVILNEDFEVLNDTRTIFEQELRKWVNNRDSFLVPMRWWREGIIDSLFNIYHYRN